jgi:hypothetical protein
LDLMREFDSRCCHDLVFAFASLMFLDVEERVGARATAPFLLLPKAVTITNADVDAHSSQPLSPRARLQVCNKTPCSLVLYIPTTRAMSSEK